MNKGDKIVLLSEVYEGHGFYKGGLYEFDSDQSPEMCAIKNDKGRRFMVRKKDMLKIYDERTSKTDS